MGSIGATGKDGENIKYNIISDTGPFGPINIPIGATTLNIIAIGGGGSGGFSFVSEVGTNFTVGGGSGEIINVDIPLLPGINILTGSIGSGGVVEIGPNNNTDGISTEVFLNGQKIVSASGGKRGVFGSGGDGYYYGGGQPAYYKFLNPIIFSPGRGKLRSGTQPVSFFLPVFPPSGLLLGGRGGTDVPGGFGQFEIVKYFTSSGREVTIRNGVSGGGGGGGIGGGFGGGDDELKVPTAPRGKAVIMSGKNGSFYGAGGGGAGAYYWTYVVLDSNGIIISESSTFVGSNYINRFALPGFGANGALYYFYS